MKLWVPHDHVVNTYNNLSLFYDWILFQFFNPILGDAKTCTIGQYKVTNWWIPLIIHHGTKLSTSLALSGQVNPSLKLALSYWPLKYSWVCQTKLTLRVTKYHRVAIFDEPYLGACVRYRYNFGCYRIMLLTPTITSLSLWRLDFILILWPYLRWC